MERKLFFVILLFITAGELFAQVQKGTLYTGVNAGRYIPNSRNTTLQPFVEVGISGHSSLGAYYSSSIFKPDAIAGFEGYGTKRGGGISFTYYRYFNKKNRWGFYLNSTVGVYDNKVIQQHDGNDFLNNRYRSGELSFTPGIFFTASPRVTFFASIGTLSLVHSKYESADLSSNVFNQLSIGIRFSFGDKKKKKTKTK